MCHVDSHNATEMSIVDSSLLAIIGKSARFCRENWISSNRLPDSLLPRGLFPFSSQQSYNYFWCINWKSKEWIIGGDEIMFNEWSNVAWVVRLNSQRFMARSTWYFTMLHSHQLNLNCSFDFHQTFAKDESQTVILINIIFRSISRLVRVMNEFDSMLPKKSRTGDDYRVFSVQLTFLEKFSTSPLENSDQTLFGFNDFQALRYDTWDSRVLSEQAEKFSITLIKVICLWCCSISAFFAFGLKPKMQQFWLKSQRGNRSELHNPKQSSRS